MRHGLTSFLAICAIAGFTAPAIADCQQELAELRDQAQSGTDGGISKDGSTAPLEGDSEEATDSADAADSSADLTAAAGESDTEEGENEVSKDGTEAPLNADTPGVATSGQEAEAQQEADAGASGEAASGAMSQEAQDAIARAEAALQAGDEAGCMEAVEEARNL